MTDDDYQLLTEALMRVRDKKEVNFGGAMADFVAAVRAEIEGREQRLAEAASVRTAMREAGIDTESGLSWSWDRTAEHLRDALVAIGWSRDKADWR